MEGVGAEVSQKIRLAIKAKLMEIGIFVDEELPDYVMVMVANKRSKEQMDDELQLFLGKHTSLFTTWLHQVLQKLQEVTVANFGAKKRKSSDDLKKKKKSKHDSDKKHLKKKIKIEPLDSIKKEPQEKSEELDQAKDTLLTPEILDRVPLAQPNIEVPNCKSGKTDQKPTNKTKVRKTSTNVSTVEARDEDHILDDGNGKKPDNEGNSQSVSSIADDMDDDDCINIRTDGELLYTAEEMIADEPSKSSEKDGSRITQTCIREHSLEKSQETSHTKSASQTSRKKSRSRSPVLHHRSPSSQRHKARSKSPISKQKDYSKTSPRRKRSSQSPVKKVSKSPVRKRSSSSRSPQDKRMSWSPSPTPPRKHMSRSRSPVRKRVSRSRSPIRKRKSRSRSPVRKRRSSSLSPVKQKERNKSSKRVGTRRDDQTERNKRLTSPQGRVLLKDSKLVDARELLNRKKAARETLKTTRSRSRSAERRRSPVRKKGDSDKESRHFNDENDLTNRSVRVNDRNKKDGHLSLKDGKPSHRSVSDRINLKSDRRLDLNREPTKPIRLKRTFSSNKDVFKTVEDDLETEENKRSGPSSRVVARPQEPEEDVDTSVPSVVKVTPRPRRPASQQPSSTLIMKAISEANKSLATIPQRPDSTQRTRKGSTFTQALKPLERIPPEKIAISISNPQALERKDLLETKKNSYPSSPRYDESARNKSPSHDDQEDVSVDPDKIVEKNAEPKETDQPVKESPDKEGPILNAEPVSETDEELDTQFVVTLNGYDPDGLFSQSELDPTEVDDNDDWLKENLDEDPVLTSTPNTVMSPPTLTSLSDYKFSTSALQTHNSSNLIEVKPNKITERCKFWPACRQADKCTFYHPSKPCKVFPACKFGDSCLYIHPQCKFNSLCTRKDCVFAHTPAHTPIQPAAVAKPKALYAAGPALTCKFFPNCTNLNCQFVHPSKVACRFGLYCTKRDCLFEHGQVAPVDKLKWSRLPT